MTQKRGSAAPSSTSSDAHRRAVAVTLTPYGHQVIEHAVDHVLIREASLLQDLDETERLVLADLLNRLDHAVRHQLDDTDR